MVNTTKKPLIQRIEDLHAVIRAEVEKQLEGKWRVTRIQGESRTRYMATLESQTHESPEYILAHGEPRFTVELIENGPVAEVISTEPFEQTMPIHRLGLTCQVWVLSTGAIKMERHSMRIPSGVFGL